VEDSAPRSRGTPWNRADELRHRTGLLDVGVLRCDLHIAQCGFNAGVAHQLHESGRSHAGAHYILAEFDDFMVLGCCQIQSDWLERVLAT